MPTTVICDRCGVSVEPPIAREGKLRLCSMCAEIRDQDPAIFWCGLAKEKQTEDKSQYRFVGIAAMLVAMIMSWSAGLAFESWSIDRQRPMGWLCGMALAALAALCSVGGWLKSNEK